jgi:N-acetylneuraminate synthase
VLLSTGMATLDEIRAALEVLAHGYVLCREPLDAREIADAAATEAGRRAVAENVTLLQCTSEYPADPADLNLRAMASLGRRFGTRVGFSDHSMGFAAALAAVALGATVIEKHFTLDRNLPGPDHRASLEPKELAAMIEGVRTVEAALGDVEKRPLYCELRNAAAARRSLVATSSIRRGEAFSTQNLGAMRPGLGISPLRYWEWIGRTATRDYQAGELIEE